MYNTHVKFGGKIPNHLGKNSRKPRGDFFDSLCIVVTVMANMELHVVNLTVKVSADICVSAVRIFKILNRIVTSVFSSI